MLTNVTVCDMLSDWKVDFAKKGGEKLSEVKFDPERLKAAMKAMRPPMGDTKLAEVAGISRQMVFYLKKGKRNSVSAEILGKIAQALKINVADLMSGQDESEKLPDRFRQLAQVASNLSEVRQEELLRIAGVLVDIEREQASTLAERQSRKDDAQAMLRLIETTLGVPASKAIERAMYTSGLFGGDTSDDGDDS